MNQGSNFLRAGFSNRDNVRVPIQLTRESQPQHLQRWFSSRTDPSIFTPIKPVLLDSQIKPVKFFQHWNQQATSCPSPVSGRSDSSSKPNSSCYHRSDAWSHLQVRAVSST